MYTHPSRAFTLIEIIIALTIIGIITSITVVTFSTARNRANDGAVKSNLAAVQVRAELYYRQNKNFTTYSGSEQWDCSQGMYSDPGIAQALNQARNASPTGFVLYGIHCRTTKQQYAIWLQRPEGASSNYWCIDSRQTACGVDLGLQQTPSGVSCGTCSVTQ